MFIITYASEFDTIKVGTGETIEDALQEVGVDIDMCYVYQGNEVEVVKSVTYTITPIKALNEDHS